MITYFNPPRGCGPYISQEFVDEVKGNYKHYIPTFRDYTTTAGSEHRTLNEIKVSKTINAAKGGNQNLNADRPFNGRSDG